MILEAERTRAGFIDRRRRAGIAVPFSLTTTKLWVWEIPMGNLCNCLIRVCLFLLSLTCIQVEAQEHANNSTTPLEESDHIAQARAQLRELNLTVSEEV